MSLDLVAVGWHYEDMYACAACGLLGPGLVCKACAHTLSRGPTFRTGSGLLVSAGFRHTGAARRLVHQLKYQGLLPAADALALGMEGVLPARPAALIPVPRALVRRWRHGIDPAFALARALSRRTGIPVAPVLRPAMWWSRHAGRGDASRSRARFVARELPAGTWVLVDDVATSGATLHAAVEALGCSGGHAVVATAPSRVMYLKGSADDPLDAGGGVAGRHTNPTSAGLSPPRVPIPNLATGRRRAHPIRSRSFNDGR